VVGSVVFSERGAAEFISNAIPDMGLITPGSTGYYIAPGKPMQNAFIEASTPAAGDELLNETLFTSLAQARVAPGMLAGRFTTTRDHTRNSDGRHLPSSPSPAIRAGIALRYAKGLASPAPVASPARPTRAIQTPGANSELDKTWGQGH